jgi:succinoglycan biosynthesis protein ExoA
MPLVSVIIPCYNEQDTIFMLLEAIAHQTVASDQMEIIIADGMSTDQTRLKIMEFQESNHGINIKVIDNHKKIIPAALNQGIAVSSGDYIIRLDAHSIPYPDYIERCISALVEGKGENIGGVWEIKPSGLDKATCMARGIAAAAAHPLGVGDAHYRHTKQARYVDTVPFGAFHRSLFDRIGNFDESLVTNEDYEFNVRIKKSGGRIWLDPAIRSIYFARSTYRQLVRQYWRYGFWKGQMLLRYPSTLRWRQALPPMMVTGLLILLALMPWIIVTRWLFWILIAIYLIALVIASMRTSYEIRDWKIIFSMPMAIVIMHLFWGSGLIWSFLQAPLKLQRR